MSKLTLTAAVGIGYVLGARAGRARYEQIKTGASSSRTNPKVQAPRPRRRRPRAHRRRSSPTR